MVEMEVEVKVQVQVGVKVQMVVRKDFSMVGIATWHNFSRVMHKSWQLTLWTGQKHS